MPFVGGIGPLEMIIILIIVIIIFGVGRLPTVGGALGKSIREFRQQARPDEDKEAEDEEEDGADAADSDSEDEVKAATAKTDSSEKAS